MTVKEALKQKTVDELKKLLSLLTDTRQPTRKAELIDAIAVYLQGDKLRDLWEQLDELQKAAVAEAVHVNQGEFQGEQFRAKYGDLPNWGERSTYAYGYIAKPSRLALFFYGESQYSPNTLMPEDMQQQLRQFVPPPIPLQLTSCETPPDRWQFKERDFDYKARRVRVINRDVAVTTCEMERAAQQDLLAVLRFVHLGKVAVSDKTFMPTKATIKAIAGFLQGGDFYPESDPKDKEQEQYTQTIGAIKAFAWPMILQATGLATLGGKKLQLTTAGQKALSAEPAKTLKAIWKKWQKNRLLDELRRINEIKGQTGKGQRGLTAVDGRRSVIVEALATCPVNRWVSVSDFVRYMIVSHRHFEVSRSPDNLYIAEPGYGHLYDTIGRWSILQTSYLRCLLFEYAATIGLLDVAYVSPDQTSRDNWSNFWGTDDLDFFSRYDGLLSFRLTPLGAYCLGINNEYRSTVVTVESGLRVLPNLEIVATAAKPNSNMTMMLEAYTQKVSDAVWRLDRNQVLTAIANGQKLADLRDFLQKASNEPLPETVLQFFTDVSFRSQSLQNQGMAQLIECSDLALATLIANDSRTKKYCLRAGENHLVVPIQHEVKFRNALGKLGYTIASL